MHGGLLWAVRAGMLVALVPIMIGSAWTWTLPFPRGRGGGAWRAILVARALVAGVVLSSIAVMTLGVFSVYTPRNEAAALGVLLVAGIAVGLAVSPARLLREMHGAAPGMAAVCAAVVAALLLPGGSEWVVGGLDPGVYANEAVALARQGTFRPPDIFFHEQLGPAERAAFSRLGKSRAERFSAIAAHRPTRTLDFEFFRLFPSALARICRAGGWEAVARGNLILGIFAATALLGLLLQFLEAPAAVAALLALLVQPVWLYHTQTPISEMMQMFLVCGAALFLAWRRESWAATAATALVLAGAALVHFSFVPIGILMVGCIVWADLDRPDRGRVMIEHELLLLALALAGAVDTHVAPLSFVGWRSNTPRLILHTSLLGLVPLAMDAVALHPGLRRRAVEAPPWLPWVGAALAAAGVAAGLWAARLAPDNPDAVTLARMLSYVGYAVAAFSATGILLAFLDPDMPRTFRGVLLFWIALSAVLVLKINKWTMPLYPWATRRYLLCVVPAVCAGLGLLLRFLWRKRARGMAAARAAAAAVVLVAVACEAGPACRAFTVREHAGAMEVLRRVAEQVREEDVLVADQSVWATPLCLAFGRNVLQAEQFYRRGPEAAADGAAALQRLAGEGWRVRFLTSTPQGLGVYPGLRLPASEDWSCGPFTNRSVIQHRNATGFRVREREKVFRLFTLQTIPPAGGGAP